MGFFSSVINIGQEANEDAHGQRLLTGVESTFSHFPQLGDAAQEVVVMGYLQILNKLQTQFSHLSGPERIKLGRTMQMQAHEKIDLDVTGSFAKWMAGAWLESSVRTGAKANEAFSLLNGLAEEAKRGGQG